MLASTVSTTTHKKSTTSQSTNTQHVTKLMATSPSANSQSVMCVDKPMCSDPHFKQMACNDLYLSTTYCPRLCHICGRQYFSMIYVEQFKTKYMYKLFKKLAIFQHLTKVGCCLLTERTEARKSHHETPGRQIKQSNQLSLPHQN